MERKLFSMRSILPLAKQGRGKPKIEAKSAPKRKEKIPVKLREEVWVAKMGKVFEGKCPTTWCSTTITVFEFESGHNIPESKGGPTTIENLVPLCPRCNRSMGSKFTFDEWCVKHTEAHSSLQPTQPSPPFPPIKQPWWRRFMLCRLAFVDTVV